MTYAKRTAMRWTLQLLLMVVTLTTSTRSSSGQTTTESPGETCEAPRRCFHPADVNAAIDAACRRAREAEATTPEIVDDLDRVETQRDVNQGRLLERREVEPAEPWRPPVALVLGLQGGGLAGAGAMGYCIGRCPPEAVVGLVVGTVAVAIGAVVLELLSRRRPGRRDTPRS